MDKAATFVVGITLCALIVLAFLYGLYFSNESQTTFVFPTVKKDVVSLAEKSYIPVIVEPTKESTSDTKVGSATQIGPNLAIICFHAFEEGSVTTSRGEKIDDRIVKISTADDIVFFWTEPQAVPEIPIAKSVEIGEVLVSVSNAGGYDGIMRYYWAAKITDTTLIVGHFGTPTIKGESGSAIFNIRGEIVGQLKSYDQRTGYGIATSFHRIRALKEEIFLAKLAKAAS